MSVARTRQSTRALISSPAGLFMNWGAYRMLIIGSLHLRDIGCRVAGCGYSDHFRRLKTSYASPYLVLPCSITPQRINSRYP
jgi:hypothetical protein